MRRALDFGVLLVSSLLLLRALGVEPYGVPTGSMAPALLGHHKDAACPRCGYPVRVGVPLAEKEGIPVPPGVPTCPNCGDALLVDDTPVCRGDYLLVAKSLYDFRRPRRWETAVFRHPATPARAFVKRVVGLPGELVQLRDGDVFIDHEIARKTLAEARAVRVPVFDMDYLPGNDGWAARWEKEPRGGPATVEGRHLRVPAEGSPEDTQWLVYRHTRDTSDKARPVSDEYGYNGGDPSRTAEAVHDFLIECDLAVKSGEGEVAFGLSDGGSEMIAELPVGTLKGGARLSERTSLGQTVFRTAPTVGLAPGKTYHVEFAFVDRRASLAVDGREVMTAVDRPTLDGRTEVIRPARLGARGVDVTVSHFRLFRDVHYLGAGPHLAVAATRLGAGEYFVLGDNSPNSDDSRFWTDASGKPVPVPERNFLGKPFLVHMPARVGADGRPAVDWRRVRWLH